jgi:hypothetical protein
MGHRDRRGHCVCHAAAPDLHPADARKSFVEETVRQRKLSLAAPELDVMPAAALKPAVVQNHPAVARIKHSEDGVFKNIAVFGDWSAVLVRPNNRATCVLQKRNVRAVERKTAFPRVNGSPVPRITAATALREIQVRERNSASGSQTNRTVTVILAVRCALHTARLRHQEVLPAVVNVRKIAVIIGFLTDSTASVSVVPGSSV